VTRISTIRRLLATLMIASLVLAPLARPAMAGTTSDAPMQAMSGHAMSDHAMSEHAMSEHAMSGHVMSDHAMDEISAATADDGMAAMPCCPSKAPASADCDNCVAMAGCASSFLTGMPTAIVLPLPIASISTQLLTNDFRPDGLGHPPPEHPPRLLV
jgi:hypothetical protein